MSGLTKDQMGLFAAELHACRANIAGEVKDGILPADSIDVQTVLLVGPLLARSISRLRSKVGKHPRSRRK